MKNLLLIFFSFAFLHTAYTQPAIAWQRCYGTSDDDVFLDVIPTVDGGFLAAHQYGGTDGDATDLYTLSAPAGLMKFDADLNLEWQHYYGGSTLGAYFYHVYQLANGDFICGGGATTLDGDFSENHGYTDFMLVKTDVNGNKLWSHCYGSEGDENIDGMIPTLDGGYLLTGDSNYSGGDIPFHYGSSMSTDAVVIKTDSMGIIQWVKVFGGDSYDLVTGGPLEMKRGIYEILVGSTSVDLDLAACPPADQKYEIYVLDSLGNVIKENCISTDDNLIFSAQNKKIKEDAVFLCGAGNAESPLYPTAPAHAGYEGAIAILDSTLEINWMRQWGGSGFDAFYRFITDEFGNYYFMGSSKSTDYDLPGNYNGGANYDYWLMKTDSNFTKLWSMNFGGSAYEGDLGGGHFGGNMIIKDNMLYIFTKCVVPDVLPDHDIQCGHYSEIEFYHFTDAWLVAFDLTTGISDLSDSKNPFEIYPNPVSDQLFITSKNPVYNITVHILNITGSIVYVKQFTDTAPITISTKNFPSGIYFIQISDAATLLYATKEIIQH